jgi:UDP-glucose 4-epimerase
MTRRVLITGGRGYLGGRIAVHLARRGGWTVRLGSRTLKPAPDWLPEAETIATDLLARESLAIAMGDVDAVVHLAAMNEHECVADPTGAVMINVAGTLNVLQAAIAAGVERFLYLSTAHVYGAPLAGELTEATIPRPIHPYAITHFAAEQYVLAAHTERKLTGLVVRLSNGFGAPTHSAVNRWTLLVNDLCRQAVTTRRMVLKSSGAQQRDFVTLEDVGRAVSHLLTLGRDQIGDGVFNLGGDMSLSIWEMASRIAARVQIVCGFTPELVRPAPGGDESTRPLSYRSVALAKTGFIHQGDPDGEIDATLLLCAQAAARS